MNKKFLKLICCCCLLLGFQFVSAQDTEGGHEKWEYVLEGSGDVLQLALPIGALTYTFIEKDWEGTKQLAFSYATSMVLTHSLKRVIHKPRPEGRKRYDAFPSGHTSSAFSGAAFIQRRYGWKHGKYAYMLATIVGVSRMEGPDGYHDIWDVLGGAGIGIGTAYIFTKAMAKNDLEIQFNSNDEFTILTVKWNF